MNTVEQFEDFHGTENYYPFNSGYAYTDAINWLRQQLPFSIFIEVLNVVKAHMGYKLPFGFFELHIDKEGIYVITTDGNGNQLYKNVIDTDDDLPDYKLDKGIYKIWCQNYVIFGASEY